MRRAQFAELRQLLLVQDIAFVVIAGARIVTATFEAMMMPALLTVMLFNLFTVRTTAPFGP